MRLHGRCERQKQLAENDRAVVVDATGEELQAWAQWGEGALQRVIGDFSFALWDAKEASLWCARDSIGARPFYYAYAGGIFCFSNTLEIPRSAVEVSGELDEAFLGDFFVGKMESRTVTDRLSGYSKTSRRPCPEIFERRNGSLPIPGTSH
jgi:Glutamine amidotransferase domain